MRRNAAQIALLACALLLCACDYIVLPEDLETGPSAEAHWSAVATKVGMSDAGDLRIELTLSNDTGSWSAMQAASGRPAVLKSADGKNTNCDAAAVGTGGHRLAPGFRLRGYMGGSKSEPSLQLIFVDCKGVGATAGATLSIDYTYVTGDYNYYYPDANKADGTLRIELDSLDAGLQYPIAAPIEGLIKTPGSEIVAINDVVLLLADTQRGDAGLTFRWQTSNPGEYPSYVHVGNPPVIGQDGIVYGLYETPDIVSVPITPAGGKTEWTTTVATPPEVGGLYILLSVESGKQRQFTHYAVDITDK